MDGGLVVLSTNPLVLSSGGPLYPPAITPVTVSATGVKDWTAVQAILNSGARSIYFMPGN